MKKILCGNMTRSLCVVFCYSHPLHPHTIISLVIVFNIGWQGGLFCNVFLFLLLLVFPPVIIIIIINIIYLLWRVPVLEPPPLYLCVVIIAAYMSLYNRCCHTLLPPVINHLHHHHSHHHHHRPHYLIWYREKDWNNWCFDYCCTHLYKIIGIIYIMLLKFSKQERLPLFYSLSSVKYLCVVPAIAR